MTQQTDSGKLEDPWASAVQTAVSALADESLSQPVQLDATAQDDLAQLLSANTRLGEIINIQGSEARHDRRNIIGAIRGYTAMLL